MDTLANSFFSSDINKKNGELNLKRCSVSLANMHSILTNSNVSLKSAVSKSDQARNDVPPTLEPQTKETGRYNVKDDHIPVLEKEIQCHQENNLAEREQCKNSKASGYEDTDSDSCSDLFQHDQDLADTFSKDGCSENSSPNKKEYATSPAEAVKRSRKGQPIYSHFHIYDSYRIIRPTPVKKLFSTQTNKSTKKDNINMQASKETSENDRHPDTEFHVSRQKTMISQTTNREIFSIGSDMEHGHSDILHVEAMPSKTDSSGSHTQNKESYAMPTKEKWPNRESKIKTPDIFKPGRIKRKHSSVSLEELPIDIDIVEDIDGEHVEGAYDKHDTELEESVQKLNHGSEISKTMDILSGKNKQLSRKHKQPVVSDILHSNNIQNGKEQTLPEETLSSEEILLVEKKKQKGNVTEAVEPVPFMSEGSSSVGDLQISGQPVKKSKGKDGREYVSTPFGECILGNNDIMLIYNKVAIVKLFPLQSAVQGQKVCTSSIEENEELSARETTNDKSQKMPRQESECLTVPEASGSESVSLTGMVNSDQTLDNPRSLNQTIDIDQVMTESEQNNDTNVMNGNPTFLEMNNNEPIMTPLKLKKCTVKLIDIDREIAQRYAISSWKGAPGAVSDNETRVNKVQKNSCDLELHTTPFLEAHMRRAMENPIETFSCNICSQSFETEQKLNVHKEAHNEATFDVRPTSFNQAEILNGRMITYGNLDSFCCAKCGATFKDKPSYNKHINLHEAKRSFTGQKPCETCGVLLRTLNQMIYHQNKHAGIRPFACMTCGDAFLEKRNLQRHLLIHTGERPFKCESCPSVFRVHNQLVKHMRIHTGEKPYVCKICNRAFRRQSCLGTHRKRVHTMERPHECPHCGKKFLAKQSLRTHIRTHTGEKPYECPTCDHRTADQSAMMRHIKTHSEEERIYDCTICKGKFASKHSLRSHLTTHEEGRQRKHKCPQCDAAFYARAHLKVHMRHHTRERKHRCEICGGHFVTGQSLEGHMRTHTGEKPYECNICNGKFRCRNNLRAHLRTHSGEKKYRFSCTICDRKFTSPKAYEYHSRIHSGELPFECNVCGSRFRGQSSLKVHKQRVHEGVKRHKCEICHAEFYDKSNLKTHRNVHEKNGAFKCEVCGLAFTQISAMIIHLRRHSGEKPFLCQQCPKRFVCQSDLNIHLRSHMAKKPYVCHICGHDCFCNVGLKRHIKTHSGNWSFKCDICGIVFARGKLLAAHKKRVHAEQS